MLVNLIPEQTIGLEEANPRAYHKQALKDAKTQNQTKKQLLAYKPGHPDKTNEDYSNIEENPPGP